jgi:hypothetical protein
VPNYPNLTPNFFLGANGQHTWLLFAHSLLRNLKRDRVQAQVLTKINIRFASARGSVSRDECFCVCITQLYFNLVQFVRIVIARLIVSHEWNLNSCAGSRLCTIVVIVLIHRGVSVPRFCLYWTSGRSKRTTILSLFFITLYVRIVGPSTVYNIIITIRSPLHLLL